MNLHHFLHSNNIPLDPYWEFDSKHHFLPRLTKSEFYKLTDIEFCTFICQPISDMVQDLDNLIARALKLSYGQKALFFWFIIDNKIKSHGIDDIYYDKFGRFIATAIKGLEYIEDTEMVLLLQLADDVYKNHQELMDKGTESDLFGTEITSRISEEFYPIEHKYDLTRKKTIQLLEKYIRQHPGEFCLDENGIEYDTHFSGEFKVFHPNGKLRESFQVSDGQVIGEYKIFDEDGEIKEQILYRNGVIVGEKEEYYKNGTLKFISKFNITQRWFRHEWFYPDGKPEKLEHRDIDKSKRLGVFKEWYANGQIKQTGQFTAPDLRAGEWLRYYEDGTLEGKWYFSQGQCENKYYNPRPTTEQLLSSCFLSQSNEEVSKAASQLKENENYYNVEFREELIGRLELVSKAHLTAHEKQRLFLIIRVSELDQPINRREILGKHYTEIENDAAFFSNIAARANQILLMLDE